MKFKTFTLAILVVFNACHNNKEITQTSWEASTLKSDVLLQNLAYKPFSRPDKNDDVSLTISGKTLLESTAVFKVVNEKGEELHCESFPSTDLIQPEYKTANSALQEAHIREVVDGFFVDDLKVSLNQNTL